MATNLTYAIKYVGDMTRAVAFHRDTLGLTLKFESPEWSEFVTGSTTLALHIASPAKPAGTSEIALGVPDVDRFCADLKRKGVAITREPKAEHGMKLAAFLDPDGAETGVSGP